ncbi:ribonuclease H-like domain-containing protein [Xylogone sp. PMI_703]|nr:ribonuclease H-like domain-containing protein [Xylogone sp. PMI_703]
MAAADFYYDVIINNEQNRDQEEYNDADDYMQHLDPSRWPSEDGLIIIDSDYHTKYTADTVGLLDAITLLRSAAFIPPRGATPDDLFSHGNRFIRRSNDGERLIYTDGACRNNGQANAAAGYAFTFGRRFASQSARAYEHPYKTFEARLEEEGPGGDRYPQTSNRAELRAVIAALAYRSWHGEGAQKLVIATDSEYVVSGATQWAWNWWSNGWRTVDQEPVKNQDLWKLLLGQVLHLREKCGITVEFWKIPREWNMVADRKAKVGARLPAQQQFVTHLGSLV